MKRFHTACTALLLFSIFTATGNAHAQTLWTNPGTGDWNAAGNWTLGVPDAGSATTFDARIENGGTPQLNATGASVRRLRVGTSISPGPGGLIVGAGGGLTVTENLHLNEGGTGTATTTVHSGGTIDLPTTVVGYSSTGPSNFLITGAGSTVTATTAFMVGRTGIGTLTMADAGALAIGGGTLPLQIATFAGSNGTVNIGNGGAAGTLQASAVQFGDGTGSLAFNHTGNLTFAIPISGTGSLVKTGAGTTTLSGTSTFIGGTTINDGTLAISSDANLGTPSAFTAHQLVLNGGTLRATETFALVSPRRISVGNSGGTISVDATKTLTYPNNFTIGTSQAPTLTKTGAGKLAFADNLAVNSGGPSEIVVQQGELSSTTLSIGANGGMGVMRVENGGLLRTGAAEVGRGNQFGDHGTGSVTVSGTGSAWLLSGPLTLAGPRGDGTLTIADGGAVSANGGVGTVTLVTAGIDATGVINIGSGGAPGILSAGGITTATGTGDGTVNFNHTGALSFGVPISGSAFVNKLGSGTTTLTGAQTYTRPTTIQAGTLVVAGSLSTSAPTVNGGALLVSGSVSSTTTVNKGGTLGGTGTVGIVNVNSGGSLSPGMSVGTLTTGTLTLNAGSTSHFELATPGVIGGGVNDLVAVNGDLLFGGTLSITKLPGFNPGAFTLFTYTSVAVNQGLAFESAFLAAHPGSSITLDTINKRVVANITPSLLVPGDFDGDGDVDGADFVVWQTNFPFTPSPGVAPIPEPESLTILLIGGGLIALARSQALRRSAPARPAPAGQ